MYNDLYDICRAYVNSKFIQPYAHTNSFLYYILFHFGIHYLIVLLMHIHSLSLSHS